MTDAKHEAPAEGMRAALVEIASRPLLDEPVSADGHRNRCPSCGHAWNIHKTPHHAPTCDRMTAIAALNKAPAEGAGEADVLVTMRDHYQFALTGPWPDIKTPNYALAGLFKMAGDEIERLRARSSAPEAREAVAWLYETVSGTKTASVEPLSRINGDKVYGTALFTHPAAPSADKLRDHLEWIETVLTDPVPGYTARIATAREYIGQALAALSTPDALKGDA